jgi:DNA-binding GntR family transcriptional regulator
MTGMTRSGNGQALVDDIDLQIQGRILDGTLQVGTWLPPERLAQELAGSRTPVREALRQLQARGLLEVFPRRGAVVRGVSARDVREAYVVRAELEGLAAALAAEHIDDAQLQRLRDAEEMFRQAVHSFTNGNAGSPAESRWPEANDLFHEVVLEACGNARLREAVRRLHESFPRNLTWLALAQSSRLLRQNVREHARILERIEQQDASGSRRAMSEHVRRAGELIAERLEAEHRTAG